MGHIASLEILRVLASISVVARHLGPDMRDLLPGGLTAMAFLSFVFVFDASAARPVEQFARSRFTRVLLPWLFWCAVYAAFEWTTAYPQPPSFLADASPRLLLIGPAVHLWYLPFVFAFGLLVVAAARAPLVRSPWLWLLLLAPACWAHIHWQGALGRPVSLWVNALPGAVLAGALSTLRPDVPRDRRLIAFAAFVALGVFVPMYLAGLGLAYFQLLAIPAIALAWSVRGTAPRALVDLGKLTYGVYLIHPLAIWMLTRWIPRDSGVALVAVSAASFGAAALLRRSPLQRFV